MECTSSLLAGNFDWREFTVATGVGFVSGAFPDVGGSGFAAGAIRGILTNETQYVLSSAWTGEEMSLEGHLMSGATGGTIGAGSELMSVSAGRSFDSIIAQAEMFNWRSTHGAAGFARESLHAYVNTVQGPAIEEGWRTFVWETLNNVLTVDRSK